MITVLSLFDGMRCGRLALQRAGVPVRKYYASEVDKYAIQVATANWPDDVNLGDVTKWREWDVDWSSIDLLIGGSPCQGFSAAGKQGGTKATIHGQMVVVSTREMYVGLKAAGAEFESQSHLFWEFVLCLDHIKAHNPGVKFLLENVKMSKPNMDLITAALNVGPVFINSALVSAQNRQRWYWASWEFGQPQDERRVLRDILETGIVDREKAYALTARYFKAGNFNRYADKSSDQIIFEAFKLTDTCIAKFKRNGVRFLEHDTKVAKPLTAGDYAKLGKYGNYLRSLDCEVQIRKLTPIECERLQTVPDNYTNHVSNTQRYKMLGNGWTVDVIAHILKGLKGPCAKTKVGAVLVSEGGEGFIGENDCLNPQTVCPREDGEGYEKCATVCKQTGHAEQNAIKAAGEKAKGGIIYLSGHTYACNSCKDAAQDAGVKEIIVMGAKA